MTPAVDGMGPVPEGREPESYDRERRRALWSMPTGLFVVGSRHGEHRNLMTANWVMQVATAPKLVALAVEAESVTRRLVEASGSFAVSVLPRRERSVVRRFVKPVRDVDLAADGSVVSMQGVPVAETPDGLPRLVGARWWLACRVRRTVSWDELGPAPSHVLVVGEVCDVGGGGRREDRGASGGGGSGSGGSDGGGADGGGAEVSADDEGILRMEDTRMNYGG